MDHSTPSVKIESPSIQRDTGKNPLLRYAQTTSYVILIIKPILALTTYVHVPDRIP